MDKGGFATGFLNPRSAERPRRGRWKPLNNLLPCASSFAIETGTPERRAPAEGQGTPCPCPSACILHPGSASTSAVSSFSGPGPFFRSAAGFPVGIPGRLAQKKRPPSRLKLGGHGSVTSLFGYEKRTWNLWSGVCLTRLTRFNRVNGIKNGFPYGVHQ